MAWGNTMRVATVEPGLKVRIPADWADELGLDEVAELEKTEGGILIRPCQTATWDQVFATKLPMGPAPAIQDLSEVSGDDILF